VIIEIISNLMLDKALSELCRFPDGIRKATPKMACEDSPPLYVNLFRLSLEEVIQYAM
jgi:hypothetical protein